MKFVKQTIIGLMAIAVSQIPAPAFAQDCGPFADQVVEIDVAYNKGLLEKAKQLAAVALNCPGTAADEIVTLHLKLAAIYDRIGLHQNTRPVAKSLAHIDKAAKLVTGLDPITKARVSLARSKYFYRAEMSERKFVEAEKHGQRALAAFTAAEDIVGQADAVHALGLIYFQRRELVEAREFFDRSLVLENSTGKPRPVMLADYGRHVGFVYLVSGDIGAAIPHFEQSFADRVRGGLRDPAMFAAVTLASALVDEGRLTDAERPLLYALKVADDMTSPSGKVRALLVAGKFHAARRNVEKARAAFIEAHDIAVKIGLTSSASRAQSSLDNLQVGVGS